TTTTHDKARDTFQKKLDSLRDGASLQLTPREFPGPVVLQRSVTLDGQGATLWSMQAPALTIAADGVVLRNFKVEFTGEGDGVDPESECAILVQAQKPPVLENVEVRGTVVGLPAEEGVWRYPLSLHVGHVPHGQPFECVLRLVVPVACKVTSNISGLDVVPHQL